MFSDNGPASLPAKFTNTETIIFIFVFKQIIIIIIINTAQGGTSHGTGDTNPLVPTLGLLEFYKKWIVYVLDT